MGCVIFARRIFRILSIDQWGEDDVNVVRHDDYGMKIKPDLIVMRA